MPVDNTNVGVCYHENICDKIVRQKDTVWKCFNQAPIRSINPHKSSWKARISERLEVGAELEVLIWWTWDQEGDDDEEKQTVVLQYIIMKIT